MDISELLRHYFDTDELDDLDPARIAAGAERLRIDFGVEREPGRRFALWVILHGLGIAPDPAIAFKTMQEREAAEAYARMAALHDRD